MTTGVAAQLVVHIKAETEGNGVVYRWSDTEDVVLFPKHLLNDPFFDINVVITGEKGKYVDNAQMHGFFANDLVIYTFPRSKDLKPDSYWEYDEKLYADALKKGKEAYVINRKKDNGLDGQVPVFLLKNFEDSIFVTPILPGIIDFRKGYSGSPLFIKLKENKVFLGFLSKTRAKNTTVTTAAEIQREAGDILSLPKAEKKRGAWVLPSIELGVGAILITAGYLGPFRNGKDIHANYSEVRNEADFTAAFPEYNSREAAYELAEEKRIRGRNLIILGGASCLAGVLESVFPLLDSKRLRIDRSGGLGLIYSF